MMVEFLAFFLVFYVWHTMGVTIGYHRLLSHKSFDCSRAVEYFWTMGGYLAFEGSPIWWATIHRAHHRYDDTALDPHSPRYGLFRAHIGWLLEPGYKSHINPVMQAPDLVRDPLYSFLEQGGDWHRAHWLALLICIIFRLLIFFSFGWVPALASLLAGLTVLQIPLMLNVVCHLPRFGYRTYSVDDDSVNVWWVSLLAMGEGWHNNHHASPGSAKTGLKRFEFDPSWLVIAGMKKLRLVGRVNIATHEQIMRRMDNETPAIPVQRMDRDVPASSAKNG